MQSGSSAARLILAIGSYYQPNVAKVCQPKKKLCPKGTAQKKDGAASAAWQLFVFFGFLFIHQSVIRLLDRIEFLIRRIHVLFLTLIIGNDLRDKDILVAILAATAAAMSTIKIKLFL